jgi:hypothetical protein
MVLDHCIVIINTLRFSSNVKFFLQICFLESNVATVSGTKLDFLNIRNEFFHFKLVLKGLSRLNPHCSNQAQPITPYMLCDMFKHFDMSSPIDATV